MSGLRLELRRGLSAELVRNSILALVDAVLAERGATLAHLDYADLVVHDVIDQIEASGTSVLAADVTVDGGTVGLELHLADASLPALVSDGFGDAVSVDVSGAAVIRLPVPGGAT